MPANPATLVLEQRYADRLRDLANRTTALVADRYRAVDPDNLTESFRRFIPAAAGLIAASQAQAQLVTEGFVRSLVRLETGRPWEPAPPDDTIQGTTYDGRALTSAMASIPPNVLLAIGAGAGVPTALRRGLHIAARFAATEPADAARRETNHQLAGAGALFDGWQWVARGTCAACLAKMNGRTNPAGGFLNGHPGCTCVMSPQIAGNPTTRPTGQDRFDAMTPQQQDNLFRSAGPEKAQAIREGKVGLDGLVRETDAYRWRSSITEGNLPEGVRAAKVTKVPAPDPNTLRLRVIERFQAEVEPTVAGDIAQMKSLQDTFAGRVRELLSGPDGGLMKRYAGEVMARAEAAMGDLGATVRAAAERAGAYDLDTTGWAMRLKQAPSLERKIASDVLESKAGLTIEEAAAGIGDSARFTMAWEADAYASGVEQAVGDLLARGFRPALNEVGELKWKNYWDGEFYRGINSNWVTPDGLTFEVQFHTSMSFATKEAQHVLYEAARISGDKLQVARLERAMALNWEGVVETPAGVTSLTRQWLQALLNAS